MISNRDYDKLVTTASRYEDDEYNLFAAEIGWEDWMEDYTSADDGECFTEMEAAEIDRILRKAFNEAHQEEYPTEYQEHLAQVDKVNKAVERMGDDEYNKISDVLDEYEDYTAEVSDLYCGNLTINELRAKSNMSQSQFARYLDIPVGTIRNWEQGIRSCPQYVTNLIKYKLIKEEKIIIPMSDELSLFLRSID